MNNRNGLGYTSVTRDVATTSKIVFVKAAATTPKPFVSSKFFKPAPPKVKKFVLTCYFCNKSDLLIQNLFGDLLSNSTLILGVVLGA